MQKPRLRSCKVAQTEKKSDESSLESKRQDKRKRKVENIQSDKQSANENKALNWPKEESSTP